MTPEEAATRLAERLAVWWGDYYAVEVMRRLGLPDGALRIGIIHYNTAEEVDRLLAGPPRARVAMLRLYWARNDGIGGHVFLGLDDLEQLMEEMSAQGMSGWLQLDRVEPGRSYRPEPSTSRSLRPLRDQGLADEKLWHDWLVFLAGAAENGGIAVR